MDQHIDVSRQVRYRAAGAPRHAREAAGCSHRPTCPRAVSPGRCAARVVSAHPGQGWSLLCNGVVLFDDYGEIIPGGGTLNRPAVMPAVHAAARTWMKS